MALEEGYEAEVLFVVQMESVRGFLPNDKTDPVFGEVLRKVREKGVRVRAICCRVTENSLSPGEELPVLF